MRITYRRKFKRYNAGISVTVTDYQKLISKKTPCAFKQQRFRLNAMESSARQIISSMAIFTFPAFDILWTNGNTDNHDVFIDYRNRIRKLNNEERLGTSRSYESSMISLKKFSKRDELFYHEISAEFLSSYEKKMLSGGMSISTIGIYLRPLRALFNEAIRESRISTEIYPFGKGRYMIPNPRNIKKALSSGEISKIFSYRFWPGENQDFYRDIWIFSYLCNGINIKDICLLKNRDISNGHITFRRAKTINTKRSDKPVNVILLDEAKQIITRRGNGTKGSNEYVFPILTEGLTAKDEYKCIQSVTTQINRTMQRIAKDTGIDKRITTYSARHSFATTLKRSGVSISYISEALGHSNVMITESYLDSFEDDAKKSIAQNLLVWKKRK